MNPEITVFIDDDIMGFRLRIRMKTEVGEVNVIDARGSADSVKAYTSEFFSAHIDALAARRK